MSNTEPTDVSVSPSDPWQQQEREPWMGRAQPIHRNVDPFACRAQDGRAGTPAEGGPAHDADR
jgi:hypothetical protein